MDQFSDFVMENLKCLSHRCVPTSCDLPQAALPVFVSFCDHTKGDRGLVSEWDAKLGTFTNDLVDEQGAKRGSFRSEL